MSVDKLVDSTQLDSDLTSVANAIRAKSGGSGSLAFPSGFVSEIGNIPSGGGGGLTTIASGTYTGTGANISSAGSGIFVGKKLPKTNFWFRITAQSDSEFPYDANYKYAYMIGIIFEEYGHFDLSTVANGKTIISDTSYEINNSGTVSESSAGIALFHGNTVRNASASTTFTPNNFRVDRTADGFYIRLYLSNTAYLFPNGLKYDWEVVYFGSNPSTDIVEIT